MSATPAALGIDFGTSHTVAALRMPGDRIESLLFDASPLLPSAVLAQPDGHLLVGHDALRGSRLDPGRLEPNPKRRVDDGTLLLGDVETPVGEAVRAVLARVAQTARRALGTVPRPVVLTHPASWGVRRRAVLAEAATGAGLGTVRLVAEPVAAALYFTEVLGHRVKPGNTLMVYDLGGGTFDVSAVRRTADGDWAVLATAGLDDVGGVDVDAAIVDWMAAHAGIETSARGTALVALRWRQLVQQEARAAKEQLSRVATASIVLPGLDRDIHLTRDEFEQLARPLLDRTVALTTSTLVASGVAADRLVGVFLVGGSSRIPLVATMLHRALGVAPTVIDQPELVVAHGSLRVPSDVDAAAPRPPLPVQTQPAPASAAPVVPPTAPVALPTAPVALPTAPVAPPPAAIVPSAAGAAPPVAAAVPGAAAATPTAGRPATADPPSSARRPVVALAIVLLLGALVGAAMMAYPLVAGFDDPIPYWTRRYPWQLLPVAGLLAGLLTRRRGTAFAAQAVSGVVAGFVGIAVARFDQNDENDFDLPWGTPVDFYYWEHNPDIWFVTLVGGCLAAGLAIEAALAATRRLGSRGTIVAIVVAAGMLPSPLLHWIFDWYAHPPLSRAVVDTLFAYPFVLLLAWPAAWLAGRPSR
ncbi:Hsp70 family protein [Plantactinospora sp. KLBMP9567]|uniref:Hsp70 family protein n=1 Tax=Plantactinospora sp. KLBMP9567 TaxID=3085900 RepID=UPI002981436E|nr:Hsp70 family protein [Plantactinospora sp. KLBMP9567]MDW5325149.1 Hsp70 family protein [Plantactinospora sp. KLBMP9567]